MFETSRMRLNVGRSTTALPPVVSIFTKDTPCSLFAYFSAGETLNGVPVIRTETFAKKILEYVDDLREKSDDGKIKARKGNAFLDFNDVGLLSKALGNGFGELKTVKNIFGYDVDGYYLGGEQLVHPFSYRHDKVSSIPYAQKIMDAIRADNSGVIGMDDFNKYVG